MRCYSQRKMKVPQRGFKVIEVKNKQAFLDNVYIPCVMVCIYLSIFSCSKYSI